MNKILIVLLILGVCDGQKHGVRLPLPFNLANLFRRPKEPSPPPHPPPRFRPPLPQNFHHSQQSHRLKPPPVRLQLPKPSNVHSRPFINHASPPPQHFLQPPPEHQFPKPASHPAQQFVQPAPQHIQQPVSAHSQKSLIDNIPKGVLPLDQNHSIPPFPPMPKPIKGIQPALLPSAFARNNPRRIIHHIQLPKPSLSLNPPNLGHQTPLLQHDRFPQQQLDPQTSQTFVRNVETGFLPVSPKLIQEQTNHREIQNIRQTSNSPQQAIITQESPNHNSEQLREHVFLQELEHAPQVQQSGSVRQASEHQFQEERQPGFAQDLSSDLNHRSKEAVEIETNKRKEEHLEETQQKVPSFAQQEQQTFHQQPPLAKHQVQAPGQQSLHKEEIHAPSQSLVVTGQRLTSRQPPAATGQQEITSQQPIAVSGQQVLTSQQPPAFTGEQTPTSRQPIAVTGQQARTSRQPQEVTGQQLTTSRQPPIVTSQKIQLSQQQQKLDLIQQQPQHNGNTKESKLNKELESSNNFDHQPNTISQNRLSDQIIQETSPIAQFLQLTRNNEQIPEQETSQTILFPQTAVHILPYPNKQQSSPFPVTSNPHQNEVIPITNSGTETDDTASTDLIPPTIATTQIEVDLPRVAAPTPLITYRNPLPNHQQPVTEQSSRYLNPLPLPNEVPQPTYNNIHYTRAISSTTIPRTNRKIEELSNSIDGSTSLLKNSPCGAGGDVGFCEVSVLYPRRHVRQVMSECHYDVEKMYVEIPEDVDALGDNSQIATANKTRRNVGERGNLAGWSWAVYSYKKEPVCETETRFIKPGFAQDITGRWQVVIQNSEIIQRVAIEMCQNPEGACKGVSDCGKKSRCVQRYNYRLLISMNPDRKSDCPEMRAFRFPSGCICHVQLHRTI